MKKPTHIDIVNIETGEIIPRRILRHVRKFGEAFAIHSVPEGWSPFGKRGYAMSHISTGAAVYKGRGPTEAHNSGVEKLKFMGADELRKRIVVCEKIIGRKRRKP